MKTEFIKSSLSLDGQTLLLEWNPQTLLYEVGTRYQYLYRSPLITDADLVLQALCFADAVAKQFVEHVKKEMRRVPFVASRYCGTRAQWEWMIIQNALLREKGLRPIFTGSKKSVIEWVPTQSMVPVTSDYQRTDNRHA